MNERQLAIRHFEFLPREVTLARRYSYGHVSMYVCVCHVTSRCFIKTEKRVELVFGIQASFHLSRVIKNRVPTKIRVLPFGPLSQTLDLETFVTASPSCSRRNSSTVELVDYTDDGQRVVAGPI